jgi:hypothetical protein
VTNCLDCDFTYADHTPTELPGEIRFTCSGYVDRIIGLVHDAGHLEAIARRPEPDIWSAQEYACHVRNVLLAQRERLFLALSEENPVVTSIHRDLRVDLARYADEGPGHLAAQFDAATEMFAWALEGLGDAGWARQLTYNFPEPAERDVLWLGRHTLHECVHHLRDFDESLARSEQPDSA